VARHFRASEGRRATPDEELVRQVRDGEAEVFAQIVRRHEGAVWKVAAAVLGDRMATENLVQQTFVNAYERLGQYQPGRDLERWLKGICRNLVREELRRRSRENKHLTHYRAYVGVLYDDEDDEAGQRLSELERALRDCRRHLGAAAARALALHYDDGLSVEQAAAAIGRTLAATRQLLFRARIFLRDCVERRLLAS
jgi:RNA polymerase sigma-70 factor (ECF subfamily)